jgi:hypothetical protein
VSFEIVDQRVAPIHAGLKRHDGADRLSLDLMRFADDCCLASSI